MAVLVQGGKLVFAGRSVSGGLCPPEVSHEQHSHIKDFLKKQKRIFLMDEML